MTISWDSWLWVRQWSDQYPWHGDKNFGTKDNRKSRKIEEKPNLGQCLSYGKPLLPLLGSANVRQRKGVVWAGLLQTRRKEEGKPGNFTRERENVSWRGKERERCGMNEKGNGMDRWMRERQKQRWYVCRCGYVEMCRWVAAWTACVRSRAASCLKADWHPVSLLPNSEQQSHQPNTQLPFLLMLLPSF